MSALASGYVTAEKLETILATIKSKNEKGFKFTIGVNDKEDQYGNNVQLYAEQTKEQRDAKANKFFFGSGKVFWTDGKITKAEKKEPAQNNKTEDGLPF